MSLLIDIASGIVQSLDGVFSSKPLAAPEEKTADERGKEFPGWNGAETGETPRTHQLQDGSLRVGSIEISALVAKQLRELGHPIESYTPGQLKEAIDACHYDGRLIDDPNGVGFSDTLHKGMRETQEEMYDDDVDVLTYRGRGGKVSAPISLPTPNQPAEQQSWVNRIGAGTSQEQESYVTHLDEERAAAQIQTAEHSTAA